MKIAILGFGIEGKETLKFIKNKYPKAEVKILDQKMDPSYLKNLEDFDVIYRSPGIPYNLPEIQKAIKNGVKVTSATNLFFELAKGTIIGVTGTKGKGTTSTLIYNILKNAGRDVQLGGNIGTPMLKLLPKLSKDSITVLELSSFQLQDLKYSPHIAVVLGMFPDHLDAHKNFREYVKSKTNIVNYQTKNDLVFYIPDDKYSKSIAKKSKGEKIQAKPDALPIKLNIPGRHNLKNAFMAAAIASRLDVSPVTILDTIKKFKGLPYRLQLIRTINGVEIYNDSASTNPQTSAAAVKSFPGKTKILIAGGQDKNLDYKTLANAISEEAVKLVVLFGKDKNKIKNALRSETITKNAKSLEKATDIALKNAKRGDVIIFSPGATSFDMFKNYIERSKRFSEIVKNLKD